MNYECISHLESVLYHMKGWKTSMSTREILACKKMAHGHKRY